MSFRVQRRNGQFVPLLITNWPSTYPSASVTVYSNYFLLRMLKQCLSTSIELELMSTSRSSGKENSKYKLVVEVAVASGQYI